MAAKVHVAYHWMAADMPPHGRSGFAELVLNKTFRLPMNVDELNEMRQVIAQTTARNIGLADLDLIDIVILGWNDLSDV